MKEHQKSSAFIQYVYHVKMIAFLSVISEPKSFQMIPGFIRAIFCQLLVNQNLFKWFLVYKSIFSTGDELFLPFKLKVTSVLNF